MLFLFFSTLDTGVCGFGGHYGETVATGPYRAFRVTAASGHCGAFSGSDSSRTSKSQGGNYYHTHTPPSFCCQHSLLQHLDPSLHGCPFKPSLTQWLFSWVPDWLSALRSVQWPCRSCPIFSFQARPLSVHLEDNLSVHQCDLSNTSCSQARLPVLYSGIYHEAVFW